MGTTSHSITIANPTGQALGRVQADGFYSPIVLGQPTASGSSAPFSEGPAQFPFGQAQTVLTGIVAHSGGGQTLATPLTASVNNIITVGAAADSVILTGTVIGYSQTVRNSAAANAAAVFPPVGGTINGGSTNASVSLAAGAFATYTLIAANTWVATS